MSTPSITTFLGSKPKALLPGLFITLINTPLEPSWEPDSETTASAISEGVLEKAELSERESPPKISEHNIGTPYHSSHYCLWFSYYCTVKLWRVYWRMEGTSVLESLPKMSEHYIEQ